MALAAFMGFDAHCEGALDDDPGRLADPTVTVLAPHVTADDQRREYL